MARIAGVDLPNNKRGEIGLTYIFVLVAVLLRRSLLTWKSILTLKLKIGMTTKLLQSEQRLLMNTKLKVNFVQLFN